jgi:sulfite exporter TauE/SafE/copper chaperone CopZ
LEEIKVEQKIIKKILKLEGLSCTACETKIENKLKKTEGVLEAEVSYKTSLLTITYDEEKITLDEIIKIIEKLDYGVSKDNSETDGKTDKNSNSQLIIIGIIVFGLYLIIKNTVGFTFIPEIDPSMGYGILFVVGLLSSLHCVAMCGGINLSLCVSYKFDKEDSNKFSKFIPSFMYNAGRVIAYTLIGGIVGALGSVFSISNTGSAFISIFAGAFMVIMGLNMLNIFPWLRRLNPHMPKVFAKKIHSEKRNKGPFIVGLLNGLMPCGPLQAMQLYALGTGSFIAGALSMFMFSLGTVPLLFAFGALGSMLSSKFTKKMVKASAMLVIVLGFVMVNRGFAFTGITINSPLAAASTDKNDGANTAVMNGDVQEISTTLESGRYTPITVKKGIPVKWTIKAESGSLNGCNNEIIVPKYNIKQKLNEGENVITFTPTETGKFGYSCWMGMIRSSITVSDDTQSGVPSQNNENSIDNNNDSNDVDNSGLPAGCCG